MYEHHVLKASPALLADSLSSYAKQLGTYLENTTYLSQDDYKKTSKLALSLIKQMNIIKTEAEKLGVVIGKENEKNFLRALQLVRVRLKFLNPSKQISETIALEKRKIEHHLSHSKRAKKTLKRLSKNFFINNHRKSSLKKRLLEEVKYHEIEKEKSMTRLAAFSRHFSLKY